MQENCPHRASFRSCSELDLIRGKGNRKSTLDISFLGASYLMKGATFTFGDLQGPIRDLSIEVNEASSRILVIHLLGYRSVRQNHDPVRTDAAIQQMWKCVRGTPLVMHEAHVAPKPGE